MNRLPLIRWIPTPNGKREPAF